MSTVVRGIHATPSNLISGYTYFIYYECPSVIVNNIITIILFLLSQDFDLKRTPLEISHIVYGPSIGFKIRKILISLIHG